jgi:hypothetical protein
MKRVTYMLLAASVLLLASRFLSGHNKFSIDLKNNSNKSLYFTFRW